MQLPTPPYISTVSISKPPQTTNTKQSLPPSPHPPSEAIVMISMRGVTGSLLWCSNHHWFVERAVKTLATSHPRGWVASRRIVQPQRLWIWRYGRLCDIFRLIRRESSVDSCLRRKLLVLCIWSHYRKSSATEFLSTYFLAQFFRRWSYSYNLGYWVGEKLICLLVQLLGLLHIAAYYFQDGKTSL